MRNAFRRFVGQSCERRSLARRRKTDWVVAIAGPVIITAVLLPFGSFFALSSVLLFVLLAVIGAALIGGPRPALAAVAVGVLAGVFLHVRHYGGLRDPLGVDLAKMLAFVIMGVAIGVLVGELTRLAVEQGVAESRHPRRARGLAGRGLRGRDHRDRALVSRRYHADRPL